MSDYYKCLEQATIVENAEYNLVRMFGLAPYIDGNMWCVLLGENLQDGVCGFGKTPYLAVLDFNKAFHKEVTPNTQQAAANTKLWNTRSDKVSRLQKALETDDGYRLPEPSELPEGWLYDVHMMLRVGGEYGVRLQNAKLDVIWGTGETPRRAALAAIGAIKKVGSNGH